MQLADLLRRGIPEPGKPSSLGGTSFELMGEAQSLRSTCAPYLAILWVCFGGTFSRSFPPEGDGKRLLATTA